MSFLASLAAGYAESEILDFLSESFPSLGPKLKRARSMGYGIKDILKTLDGADKKKLKKMDERSRNTPDMGYNPRISALRTTQETSAQSQLQSAAKGLGTAALAAGTMYGAGKLLPKAAQMASSLLPGIGGPTGGQPPMPGQGPIGPQPMANAPVSPPPIPQTGAASPAIAAGAVQPQAAPMAQSAPQPSNSINILQQMGLGSKIDTLKQAGNSPEGISAALQATLKPGQIKWLGDQIKSGAAKPLPDMVQEYLASQPEQQPRPQAEIPQPSPQSEPIKEDEIGFLSGEQKIEPITHKKGSVVATPDGIVGDIKDIKEKEALVQSDDGKVHKVKVEDLEQPHEDLIEATKKLLKIPEVEKSSVISLVTFRPKTKQMFVQYHNGETYVYEDIPEERAIEIQHALGVAKTTGQNSYGAWAEDVQSRGAALIHNVLRDPRYAKDQEGKTWEKLGTYYDYWEKLRKQPKRKRK